jgi:hypothetical protein
MALWPALALLVGLGVERLVVWIVEMGGRGRAATGDVNDASTMASRAVSAGFVALWLVFGVWRGLDPAFAANQPGAEPTLAWQPFDSVLDTLEYRLLPDDRIALHVEQPGREWLTEPIVDYYFYPFGVEFRQMEQIPGLREGDDYFRNAYDFVDNAARLWVVNLPHVPAGFQADEFRRALAEDHVPCGRALDLPGIQLDLYVAERDRGQGATNYLEALNVGGVLLERMAVRDGRVVVVVGWLFMGDPPPPDTRITLAINRREDNADVGETTVTLKTDHFYTCQQAVIDVGSAPLPPGSYRLFARAGDDAAWLGRFVIE